MNIYTDRLQREAEDHTWGDYGHCQIKTTKTGKQSPFDIGNTFVGGPLSKNIPVIFPEKPPTMIIKEITVSDSRQLPDGNWKKLEWVAELEKDEVPEIQTRIVKERIDQTFVMVYGVQPNGSFIHPVAEPEAKTTPEDETKNIISSIEKCENESQLSEYKLVALKNVQTKGAYNLRKKQLNIE